jgi:hypothetical protein
MLSGLEIGILVIAIVIAIVLIIIIACLTAITTGTQRSQRSQRSQRYSMRDYSLSTMNDTSLTKDSSLSPKNNTLLVGDSVSPSQTCCETCLSTYNTQTKACGDPQSKEWPACYKKTDQAYATCTIDICKTGCL